MEESQRMKSAKSLHRIDLSLATSPNESCEIFYTSSSSHIPSIASRRARTLVERRKASAPQRIRSPARLKHFMGPISVNMYVEIPLINEPVKLNLPESFSRPMISSAYPSRKARPTQQNSTKDDENRSQSSSTERILYESSMFFEDLSQSKAKLYHLPLTAGKILHTRRSSKMSLDSKKTERSLADQFSQESFLAGQEKRFYDKIEHLTRQYFPSIQQLRHRTLPVKMTIPHREGTKNFQPILSREVTRQ